MLRNALSTALLLSCAVLAPFLLMLALVSIHGAIHRPPRQIPPAGRCACPCERCVCPCER